VKLIAVIHKDFEDARVDFLLVPKEIDIREQSRKHIAYLNNIYFPKLEWYNAGIAPCPEYFTLSEWLIRYCDAEKATEKEITIVED